MVKKPKFITLDGKEIPIKEADKRKKHLNIAIFHPWTSPETRKKHEIELNKLNDAL